MRFGRFSLVGLLGAAVQVFVADLLIRRAHWPPAAAAAIAVEAAVLHNYFWHERFTWRDRNCSRGKRASRLVRFHVANGLVSMAGNALIISCLTAAGIGPRISALAAIACCSPMNFLLADGWVYRDFEPSLASRFWSCSRERPAKARHAPVSTKSPFSLRSQSAETSGCGVSSMSHGVRSKNA